MEERNTRPPRALEGAAGWDRDAVTYRLTPTRKSRLLALLGGAKASPTDALDAALDRATSARLDEGHGNSDDPRAQALNGLQEQIHALAEAARESTEIREALGRIERDCAEVRHAIASAAALADGVAVDASEPIAGWLGRADPSVQWMVCKLRWRGKRSTGAGMAMWDAELRELRREGAVHLPKDHAVRVALGPALAGGPLARIEGIDTAVVCCARSSHGWTLSFRSALEDGKLGEPFAELSI